MPENKNSFFQVVITGLPLVQEAMAILSGKCPIRCTEAYQNSSREGALPSFDPAFSLRKKRTG